MNPHDKLKLPVHIGLGPVIGNNGKPLPKKNRKETAAYAKRHASSKSKKDRFYWDGMVVDGPPEEVMFGRKPKYRRISFGGQKYNLHDSARNIRHRNSDIKEYIELRGGLSSLSLEEKVVLVKMNMQQETENTKYARQLDEEKQMTTLIKDYIEDRGGIDALTEEEKRILVEISKRDNRSPNYRAVLLKKILDKAIVALQTAAKNPEKPGSLLLYVKVRDGIFPELESVWFGSSEDRQRVRRSAAGA